MELSRSSTGAMKLSMVVPKTATGMTASSADSAERVIPSGAASPTPVAVAHVVTWTVSIRLCVKDAPSGDSENATCVAGRSAIADVFCAARPSVRPESMTTRKATSAMTVVMSMNLPLANQRSLKPTNMVSTPWWISDGDII